MLTIELLNNTVSKLQLDYVPDHWPAPGKYKILGIHIEKPWRAVQNMPDMQNYFSASIMSNNY